MRYLDRLRAGDVPTLETALTAKSPFDSFGSSPSEQISANVGGAVAEAVNDESARRWRVCFRNLAPIEVIFTPDASRAEVAAIYPGARIEPLRELPGRTATPVEADELRALAVLIFADASDAERDEVLAVACADTEAALASFRLLAADLIERKRHEAQFGSA